MKNLLIYVLGIITGVILSFYVKPSDGPEADGAEKIEVSEEYVGHPQSGAFQVSEAGDLEMFESTGEDMGYSRFELFQVVGSGYALAHADDSFGMVVLIMPNEGQRFYDGQEIVLADTQCARHVGLYTYDSKMGIEKTVPAVRIMDRSAPAIKAANGTASSVGKAKGTAPAIGTAYGTSPVKATRTTASSVGTANGTTSSVKTADGIASAIGKIGGGGLQKPKAAGKSVPGKTLFDVPGDYVSRNDFEVQRVLESGDAIALEITKIGVSGYVFTSDLEVLIQAREGSNFYDKQIIRATGGKYARHIGNYKYQKYGSTKVIPIVDFI